MLPVQTLRTLAFRLAPEVTELPFSYRVLSFPARWTAIVDDLNAAVKRHKPSQYGPRVKALKQLALALFPQLISAEDYPRPNASWLYSTTPIEAEHLQLIFSTWIGAGYTSLGLQLPRDLEKELYEAPLVWSEETRDLAGVAANRWGTASLTFNKSFDLIPELLADAISRRGVVFDYHSQPLAFRRAPSAGNGVELISWPTLQFRNCAYSIFFKFTLQTVPFQPFPVIYCDMGIRRWVSAPGAHLGRGDHSVYLLTRLAGVEANDHTQRFQMASVRRKKMKEASGGSGEQLWQTVWDDLLPELFSAIHPPHRLPSADELTREPLAFINRRDLSAAIVVNNTMPAYQHSVRHGLTPVNRSHLTEQLAMRLQPFGFIHVAAPHRVPAKAVSSTRNVFFPPPEQTDGEIKAQAAEVRCAVAKATGGRARFELWYQSSTVLDALLNEVSQTFGLEHPGKEFRRKKHCEWKTPELSIELRAYLLGDLANEIEGAKRDWRGALWRRAEEVVSRVRAETAGPQPVSGGLPVSTFVELADASYYKDGDPKDALRAGFAEAGRVTQFITPLEDELTHRAKMSLLDLLRQLGVQSGLPSLSKKVFPRPAGYAAVWLYKPYEDAKRYLPMMLWMAADGSEVRATASGLNEFVSYPQFLKRLAERGAAKYINHAERGRVPILIRQWLDELRNDSADLLLLAHSQNTRGAWNWLQDGRIAPDQLTFGDESKLTPISEWPGVRVVRVRDCVGSETPESFAQRDRTEGESHEDSISFTQGLFKSGERVFYSLTGKPRQRINLSRKASKSRNPDLQAWNARIVELTVACIQEGDEPWHWAMLAHRLREAAVHYDDPMTFPLPLHLLDTAWQYAQIGAVADLQAARAPAR